MRNDARRQPPARRGTALWVSLASLATCTMVAVSLSSGQFYAARIAETEQATRSLALAAHDGLATGIDAVQADDWGGVSAGLTRSTTLPAGATQTVAVTFAPVPSHPMRLRIDTSATRSDLPGRIASGHAIVELVPRLGDGTSEPSDVVPLPASYEPVANHSVVVLNPPEGPQVGPNTSLEGRTYSLRPPTVLAGTTATATAIADLETGFGDLAASYGTAILPHPLVGALESAIPPSGAQSLQYGRLGVTHSSVSPPSFPPFDETKFASYRIFAGGPTYQATTVGGYVADATLGPTEQNPLGIFYRDGNVTLGDDVTIIGTLACRSLTVDGQGVRLASSRHDELLPSIPADQRPRPFAVACEQMNCRSGCRLSIDGGVLCLGRFTREGHHFETNAGSVPSFLHSAAVVADSQPTTTLQFGSGVSVDGIDPANHELWVVQNLRGGVHEIASVDAASRSVAVVGDLPAGETVAALLVPRRIATVDIRGQLYCVDLDVTCSPHWRMDSGRWSRLHSDWTTDNNDSIATGYGPIRFHEWLAVGSNHLFWPFSWPHILQGQESWPTFLVRPATVGKPHWQTPLFSPATGPSEDDAGYRWRVLEWTVD